MSVTQPTEIRIPVPWGHIAAKSWGKSDGLPLLGIHGLQDNAATFDKLAPLLPTAFHFVSVDLPGHGLSSHFPPGQLYHFLDMMTVINRITSYLKWDKFYYLGHSLGAQIGVYFSSFYPDRIVKLIMLDAVKPRVQFARDYMPNFRRFNDLLLELETKLSNRPTPCYTYEEAKQRMFESRWSELTEESADIMLQRSLKTYNGGYTFAIDQRLKFFVFPPHTDPQQLAILSNLKCSMLVIKAEDSTAIHAIQGFKDACALYKKICPHYEEIVVHGNHDVHINYPERVSTLISNFLLHNKSKI